MRILITGASGLLGLNLALFTSRENPVIGVDRNTLPSAPFPIIQADLQDALAVSRVLDEARPDAVIHCAAIADVDACESNPDAAHRANAAMPRFIAEACNLRKIRLVHISTDAVFSGRKHGAYSEEDVPDPLGVYGITKLEGEKAVLQADSDASVFRVNFYGWSVSGRRSLAEFFVNHLSRGATINGFTDVRFCPLFAGHLAGVILKALPEHLAGIYHVVGPQAMTKYQFGVEIAHKFGLPARLISPQSINTSSLTAKRAHNLWLSTHKISTALGLELPEFSTGLDAFYAQFQQGYPQKIRGYQQPAKAPLAGA
jgi:dTDP-4-dehydrorhamnose reductase